MTDNPNRPEPTKTFKPKNYARIFGSCKGERWVDDGVKTFKACKKCGVVSKKKKCQFCGTERGKWDC